MREEEEPERMRYRLEDPFFAAWIVSCAERSSSP